MSTARILRYHLSKIPNFAISLAVLEKAMDTYPPPEPEPFIPSAPLLKAKQVASDEYLGVAPPDQEIEEKSPFAPKQNVVGIAVGAKIKGGKLCPAEKVVVFFVKQKAPKEKVGQHMLPNKLEGCKTDVIQTGEFIAATSVNGDPKSKQRPVRPGCSVGTSGTTGTLGAIVRAKWSPDGTRFILSNYHVLVPEGSGRGIGVSVTQPGPEDLDDANPGAAVVATVKDSVQLQTRKNNDVDCAIAELNAGIDSGTTPVGGVEFSPFPEPAEPKVFLQVKQSGRSGPSEGRIMYLNADVLVTFPEHRDRYVFVNQLGIQGTNSRFGEDGDSGSLVITAYDKKPVGLFFAIATKGGYGLANPINTVLESLHVELVAGS